MTLLTTFAELGLSPTLSVMKSCVCLALGTEVFNGVTIEAVLLEAAYHVLGTPIAEDAQAKVKAWIQQHEVK
jgi:hypothetical protein